MPGDREHNLDNPQHDRRVDWIEVFVIILLIASLFAVIFMTTKHSFISDQGLVIGFFGILATIVVLGNYTQAESMRHETEREVDKMHEHVTDIEKIKQDLYKEGHLKLELFTKEEITKLISEEIGNRMFGQVALFEQNIDKLYDYCVAENYKEFIKIVVKEGKRYQCLVRIEGSKKRRRAWAKFIDNKIVFRDSSDNEFQKVIEVKDMAYNEEKMNRLANLWKETHHQISQSAEIDLKLNDADGTLYAKKDLVPQDLRNTK